MDNEILKRIVEALLMSTATPLRLNQIQGIFEDDDKPTIEQLQQVVEQLAAEYATRSIELTQVATGYCLQTKAVYSTWVSRLQVEKQVKYSRALLETLAIVAYKQPVTRADIEDIRGVAVNGSIIKTLLEREWIKIAGHRDVPGKPAVYVTTNYFLDYFNLTSLKQLPPLTAINDALEIMAPQPLAEHLTNEK